LEDHLTAIRDFYKDQADFMMTSMKQYFPEQVKWIVPKGGMFIWVTLPDGMESSTLLEKAIEYNVLFVPGQNFYVGGEQGKNSFRMNFSNPSKEEISTGIRVLGALIREMQ
jgi:2-aminoadipate transaminase